VRFYGISSEDRVLELAENINPGEWIFEDTREKKKEVLSEEKAKEKLKEIVDEVRSWREQLTTLTRGTVFIFVHEPDSPRAFKIYDPSSLGCSTSLTPPRWKLYLRELGGI